MLVAECALTLVEDEITTVRLEKQQGGLDFQPLLECLAAWHEVAR